MDRSKVRGDAKRSVECCVSRTRESPQKTDSASKVHAISLGARLRSLSLRSSSCGSACVLCGLVGTARVRQGVTDELSDYIDILCGGVGEGGCVDWLIRKQDPEKLASRTLVDWLETGFLTVVKANAELDLGYGT